MCTGCDSVVAARVPSTRGTGSRLACGAPRQILLAGRPSSSTPRTAYLGAANEAEPAEHPVVGKRCA
jgi:hypothetical protein